MATGMILFRLTGFTLAQCPEDTVDSGVCDTLHVEFHDPRQPAAFPWEVHIPILVTHDVPDPALDSVHAFMIPLKLTRTNPAAYCSIPRWKNTTDLYPSGDTANSIFRHFGEMENRMMSLAEQDSGLEWDLRDVEIEYDTSGAASLFLLFAAINDRARNWWEGSRTLLTTLTLLVEDSMTVCMDTCPWPPAGHLYFTRWGDAKSYIPRPIVPPRQRIFPPTPPWFPTCPDQDQEHNTNGHFASEEFEAWGQYDSIYQCTAEFSGQGVDNVTLHYHGGLKPPGLIVRGHVEYDVTDHYQKGGYVRIGVMDKDQEWCHCVFNVVLLGRGDCNGDGGIDISDVIYLINYLFIGGPAPDPVQAGDANLDGTVNIADAVYLINYLFIGGPLQCN